MAEELLGNPSTSQLMAMSCLLTEVPSSLLALALSKLPTSMSEYIRVNVRLMTADARIRLLHHVDEKLSKGAFVGMVVLGIDNLDPETRRVWESALERHPSDDYWVPQIFRTHPELLSRWLTGYAQRHNSPTGKYEHIPDEMCKVIASLPLNDRKEILAGFPTQIDAFSAGQLIQSLVGDDAETCRQVFERPDMEKYRAAALTGSIDERWVERATIALEFGWEPGVIVEIPAYPWGFTMYHGEESEHWGTFLKSFSVVAEGPTVAHKLLGEAGMAYYQAKFSDAFEKERRRAISGDF